MAREYLTDFDLMILLAILRIGDEAYGVPIARELEETAGGSVLLDAIYAGLDRLEDNGLVTSTYGDPTPDMVSDLHCCDDRSGCDDVLALRA